MATLTAVPVEEYLRTTYHPDREYVDGQLIERHGFEYDHSRLQVLLAAELEGASALDAFDALLRNASA